MNISNLDSNSLKIGSYSDGDLCNLFKIPPNYTIQQLEDAANSLHQVVFNSLGIHNQNEILIFINESKTRLMNKLQNNNFLSFIYDSNQIIYNEKEFRSSDSEILRLDRLIIKDNHAIIIDYKTSKGENDINQVRNYLSNINLCGFSKVSAFLLYVSNQELVEVTS